MTEYPSIFNNVLGPITPGPSSSNTCGPVRISLLCRQVFGGTPKKAEIEFPVGSAFPATYIGMKSDIAFINGLLGKEQNNAEFTKAYQKAEEAGLRVSFGEKEFPCHEKYLETARLKLTDGERKMEFLTASIGGGMCLIYGINGFKADVKGDQYELIVLTERMDSGQKNALLDKIRSRAAAVNDIISEEKEDGGFFEIKLGEDPDEGILNEIKNEEFVKSVQKIVPVHPVVINSARKPPFATPQEMEQYCSDNKITPVEGALRYESALSGWSEAEVLRYGEELIDIMEESVRKGMESNFAIRGIVTPKAKRVQQAFISDNPLSMGFLDYAVPISLGVMEYSNACGKIVCLPTGGSSGIVPGAIFGAAKVMGLDKKALTEALLTAGMVGVFMANDNNFGGGDYGCQTEVGCATSMAAGALAQILGGSVRQICDAASMGMQSLLGLICDPVAGLVQVPCLARNMTAVSVAATSANAVMAGFEVVIPLKEAVEAMIDLGKRMPVDFRGCGSAGCCITPTGCRLKEEQEALGAND